MPLIVRVDKQLCQGHGLCHSVDADLFPLDEYGYCVRPPRELLPAEVAAGRAGAAACPEEAITIEHR